MNPRWPKYLAQKQKMHYCQMIYANVHVSKRGRGFARQRGVIVEIESPGFRVNFVSSMHCYTNLYSGWPVDLEFDITF
jgi:hypothetical protein